MLRSVDCQTVTDVFENRNALIFKVEVKLYNGFSVTLNMIWRDIPEDFNLFCQHRCENSDVSFVV